MRLYSFISVIPLLIPLAGETGGFSEQTRTAVSNMPQPAVCTDSFLAHMREAIQPDSSLWILELQQTDANSDGFITIEESGSSEEVSRLFSQVDLDGDDVVSQREAIHFTTNMILTEYVRQFRRMDLDKSNTLTDIEIGRSNFDFRDAWEAFDGDQDNIWSFNEFMEWRKHEDGLDLKGVYQQYSLSAAQ